MENKIKNIVNLTQRDVYILREKHFDIQTPVRQFDIEKVKNTMCDIIPPVDTGKNKRAVFCGTNRNNKQKIRDVILTNCLVGGVTNGMLPKEEKEDTIYIVPNVVYNSLYLFRKDIYIIDEPIKSVTGTIIACKSLTRVRYTTLEKEIGAIVKELEGIMLNATEDEKLYMQMANLRLRIVKINN